jgi:hypothetical protein
MPRVSKPKKEEVKEVVEETPKPKKSFSLKLTKQELVHLRDLFGILLPVELKSTVSQFLAAGQGRQLVESKLWNKISQLCAEADIPMGDDAPDFIVTMNSPPQLGVFEMAPEEDDEVSEEDVARGIEAILNEDK